MDFEGYLYKIGRQKSTIKKHLIRLSVLNRGVENWNISGIDEFLLTKIKEGLRHTSLNAYVDTIRLYSQFKEYSNELCDYRHYKIQHAVKGTFSDDEITQLEKDSRFEYEVAQTEKALQVRIYLKYRAT